MPVTSATLAAAMKTHYLPRLRDQLHRTFIFLRIAQQAEQAQMTGSSVIVKMKIGNTSGIVNPSAEGGVFPTATQSSYLETTIPLARTLGTVEVPRELILRAKGNPASLVQPLNNEVRDMYNEFKRDLNWNFYRDKTGNLATVSGFAGGTPDVVTVDTTEALQPGMVIDFWDDSGGVELPDGGDVVITDITSLTTFTCDMVGTPASPDTIQRANSRGNASQGLDDIIATSGVFQGVNSANYFLWQANVITNGSLSDFTPMQLKNLLGTIERRLKRNSGLIIITSPEVYNAMGWVLMGSRQYLNSQTTWEGFWNSFEYDGNRVVKDPDCPRNTIYIVDKRGLLLGILGGSLVNLVDDDGSSYRLALSGGAYRNSLNAHFDGYATLACTERQGHGKITNIRGLDDSGSGYGALGGYT